MIKNLILSETEKIRTPRRSDDWQVFLNGTLKLVKSLDEPRGFGFGSYSWRHMDVISIVTDIIFQRDGKEKYVYGMHYVGPLTSKDQIIDFLTEIADSKGSIEISRSQDMHLDACSIGCVDYDQGLFGGIRVTGVGDLSNDPKINLEKLARFYRVK